jgi:glycyl-tRNA synthetase
LGIKKDNLRLREHKKDELSHYANAAIDIEYLFPNGWGEIFGSHDRGQFDLKEHEKFSKKDLKIFDEETKKKILPLVIESSFGIERAFLAFMFDSYFHDAEKKNVVLKLHPKLSPVKVAIFPIVKREEFKKISREIFEDLKKEFNTIYDESGSIGRRYARNDEAGTPFCVTIDDDSLKNKNVTVRDRNNGKQVRIKLNKLKESLKMCIEGEDILKFGKLINTRKK